MARRKKTARRGRRGRVGGVIPKKYQADTNLMLGMVGGLVLARMVPNMLQRAIPGLSPKMFNLVQSGAGIVVSAMFPKAPLLRGVGLGVAAMGALDLATNMGIIPGADGAVSGREVMINLDEVGYGYPRNLVAGGVGATFNDKAYVDSVIAGSGYRAMAGSGLY